MRHQSHLPTVAFGFDIGECIEIDDQKCRIHCGNKDGTVTFIAERTARPFDLTHDQFMAKLNAGNIVLNCSPDTRPQRGKTLLEAILAKTSTGVSYIEVSAYRAAIVRALADIPRRSRTRSHVDRVIARAHSEYLEKHDLPAWLAQKRPPSRSSVYRWLKAAGQIADARMLVPSFHLRGTRGARFHPLIEEKLDELMHSMYFDAPEARLSSAIFSISHALNEWIPSQRSLEDHPTPSYGTIRNRILALGGERRLQHEEGKRAARLAYKQVMMGPDLVYPMARWEIDHTKIDINVVDNEGNLVIGRVWLTCVMDHTTRMIAGYLLSAEAPDTTRILEVLRFSMLPKTRPLLDSLGVKSDWPIAGVPSEVATDRGKELLSGSAHRAFQVLGIDAVIMPPRTPQAKGRIERFFGTLNTLLFHQFAGTTKSNPSAKGDRKPLQEARVTFDELNSLIARTICDVYHNKRHSVLRSSPLQMWNKLTARYPVVNLKSGPDIREATMLSYEATVTRSGIRIEGIQYGSPDLARIRSRAHAHVRSRGNPMVPVLLDPDDVSLIRVRDPQTGQLIEVPALEFKTLNGMSLRKLRFVREAMAALNLDSTNENFVRYLAALTADQRRINRRRRKHGAVAQNIMETAPRDKRVDDIQPKATSESENSVKRPSGRRRERAPTSQQLTVLRKIDLSDPAK